MQFDCIQGENAFLVERVSSYILNLMGKGFGEQILLSHDICLMSNLNAFGGCGYDYIPTRFIPVLREKGLSGADITTLTVDNPRRALTGAG